MGVSVYPLAYPRNHTAELHQIFVHIVCSRGSVFRWRHCNTLCISGFVDYVTFSHIWRYAWRVMCIPKQV